MIAAILLTAVLAAGPADPARDTPLMRIEAAGLTLSESRDAALFADLGLRPMTMETSEAVPA